jgi:hypothetical protein
MGEWITDLRGGRQVLYVAWFWQKKGIFDWAGHFGGGCSCILNCGVKLGVPHHIAGQE